MSAFYRKYAFNQKFIFRSEIVIVVAIQNFSQNGLMSFYDFATEIFLLRFNFVVDAIVLMSVR